jgi:predicted nucleotide-binding protein (sugar kinase/HSP70/actin superfamily)
MGNIYIAVKTLFDGLGIDYVIPPLNSKSSLEIGSLHSPDEICFPFKLMVGNYIEAIEQGADTVVLTGSCGPCRFGEYCELQMNLLRKLGHNVKFIVIDSPNDIGAKELLRRLSEIGEGSSKTTKQKFKAIYDAIKVLNYIDDIEKKAYALAGYERTKGECKKILNSCKRETLACHNPNEMIALLQHYRNAISKVQVEKNRQPVKIAVIGEIYTIIEPFSNLFLHDKLMNYGISSARMLTASWWVKDMVLKPTRLNSLKIKRSAKEYLPVKIGGHAVECIGEAVLSANSGFDGAIQILPMGCMPEIVSKSILPKISKDKDFPIMTLVVDEMTGEAGYVTRIEAFIDLLERRRENVLSRC